MNRIFRALRSTARSRIARIATSILLSSEIAVIAQTFTTLYSFNGTGGGNPHAPLVQGNNGNLYGTTANGAIENRGGTIYEITPGGALTTRYQFCSQAACADGAHAVAGLTQAPNFFLYGATSQGGAHAFGTVFESTPNGAVVTEYSFCSQPACTDGAYPSAGLAQAFNGTLYGTTSQGGAQGQGTVFRITPDGAFTTLYSFCAQPSCADGANPDSGLVQTVNEDGDFYGTTPQGGSANHGTLFKITTDGLLTTLYDFCSEPLCADGSEPNVGLKAYDTRTN